MSTPRLLGYIDRWKVISSSVAGLLSAIALMANKFEAVVSGRILLAAVGGALFFKTELLTAAVIILFLPVWRRIGRDGVAAAEYFIRTRRQHGAYLLRCSLVAVGICAAAGVIVYSGRRYYRAKKYAYHSFARQLALAGSDSYRHGDAPRARLLLRIGSEILHDAGCTENLEALSGRLQMADELRKVYGTMSVANPKRYRLLVTIYSLDRDYAKYTQARDAERTRVSGAIRRYRDVLELALRGQRAAAIPVLTALNDELGGMGDVAAVLRECSGSPNGAMPHMNGIARMGTQAFVKEVAASLAFDDRVELKSLDTMTTPELATP